MTTLVSIHKIVISDPHEDLVFTGSYTADGEPIVRKKSLQVEPSSFFEMSDATEAEWLISVGAARHPSPTEVQLGRVQDEDYAAFREFKPEAD